jgi:MerR family mercuric resistance operon transcriptional regulator
MAQKPRIRPPLLIGKLSVGTGVNVETIRYYERAGLLPPPPRTAGKHRSYNEAHFQRLAFIRRSRELGFSIDEIRVLLDLVDHGSTMCSESVKQISIKHLRNVRAKIASLKKLEAALSRLTGACKPGEDVPCPILEDLFAPGSRRAYLWI